MNMISSKRLCRSALLALLAAAAAGAQAPDPWAALQQENTGTANAGYVLRLRQQGFTPDQARQTLACLTEAQRQEVPLPALTTRLEEGLAKKAEPQTVMAAVQTRLRVLTQARTLLQAAHYGTVPELPRNELLTATGLALESGVPADDLASTLQRGQGQNALRLKSIIEAGESLRLAGVDRATTQSLMNDCLERNLRRMEVIRAVHYSIQQHRGGMDGENIRRSLWGGNAATEGARGRRGGGQGGAGNCEGSGAATGNGWRGGMNNNAGSTPPATSGMGSSESGRPVAPGGGSVGGGRPVTPGGGSAGSGAPPVSGGSGNSGTLNGGTTPATGGAPGGGQPYMGGTR
jgi:hypothetical protein